MALDSSQQSLVEGAVPAGLDDWQDDDRGPPVSLLLKLITVANFLPVETSLMLGGLRLPAARLMLLLAAPYLLAQLGSKIANGCYRFVISDALVLLTGCWMLFASASVMGLGDALNHAGPEILEFCCGYLATRALLAKRGQAVKLINLLCITIAVVGLIAALDPLADRFVTHEIANSLTGYGIDVVGRPDYRLGMRRAAGTVEHPILLGTACMVGLLCAGAVPLRGRLFAIVGCAVGLVVSVSSAPLQGAIMGFGLLIYGRLFNGLRWRWWLLATLLIAFILLSEVVLGSPLGFVNQYLVFDSASGYSRELEWQTVGEYVMMSPWTGIGFSWAAIVEQIQAQGGFAFASIDTVWLGMALVYGIPCSALIALSLLGSTWLPTSGPDVYLSSRDSRLGTVLGIIMCLFLFIGFTVYFWGSVWILCALLAGIRAHLGELGQLGGGAGRFVRAPR